MDNREAKFILSAYRPGGQDANDSRFSEALEQVRRDPILERWFRESVGFDSALTEKLRALDAPADLRESILAGSRVSRPHRWSNAFIRWAIAAAVILCATLAPLIWHNWRPAHLAGWQSEALDVVSSLVRNESNFDAQSHDAAELVGWLSANHAPAVQKLPPNLEKLESLGCKTFSWNGTPVSVICFVRPDGGLIHLVLAKAADGRRDNVPRFVQQGDWATATWRSGDMICMLALEGRADQLRSYVL
jgi:hypothetical protein